MSLEQLKAKWPCKTCDGAGTLDGGPPYDPRSYGCPDCRAIGLDLTAIAAKLEAQEADARLGRAYKNARRWTPFLANDYGNDQAEPIGKAAALILDDEGGWVSCADVEKAAGGE